MADSRMEVMESRLSNLENQVFGKLDKKKTYPKVIDGLSEFNSRLNSSVTGREKITSVLKRLNEIEKYVDSEYADSLTISEAAKMQIILSEETRIRKTVDQLENLQELKPVLDSEHIKSTPLMTEQLLKLSQIQVKQQEESDNFSEEIGQLLASYNKIINTISKQFVYWEDIVTKAEIAALPKKRIE